MQYKYHFDIAQICVNGHLVNPTAEANIVENKIYCQECGFKTITECPDCNTSIKGKRMMMEMVFKEEYNVPKFCDSCGNPYPWTKKANEAIAELIELSELNSVDKQGLALSIEELLVDNPKTNVAVVKFKRYVTKAGQEIASAMKEVLIEIVSETVKKSIWG